MELKSKSMFLLVLIISFVDTQKCNFCDCKTETFSAVCNCTEGTEANCSSNGELIFSAQRFYISSKIKLNRIEKITIHDVHMEYFILPSELGNLRKLTLDNCSMKTINCHYGLELTELVINNNNVETFSDKAFDNVKNLKSLDLQSNQIRVIPANVFADLEYLVQINLGDNKLKELDSNLFAYNFNLEDIFLFNNDIDILPETLFENLSNIVYIDLRNNEIQELPDGIFSNLNYLQEIHLEKNRISIIAADAFINSLKLEKIYLEENHIKRIDYNILTNIPKLTMNVHTRSLICDCSDRIFFETLMKNMDKISGDIECLNSTKKISDLSIQDFVCAPKILQCSNESHESFAKISCKLETDVHDIMTWTKNGFNIHDNAYYKITIDDDWSNLTILSFSEATSGSYKLEVNNSKGYDSTYSYEYLFPLISNNATKFQRIVQSSNMFSDMTINLFIVFSTIFVALILIIISVCIRRNNKNIYNVQQEQKNEFESKNMLTNLKNLSKAKEITIPEIIYEFYNEVNMTVKDYNERTVRMEKKDQNIPGFSQNNEIDNFKNNIFHSIAKQEQMYTETVPVSKYNPVPKPPRTNRRDSVNWNRVP